MDTDLNTWRSLVTVLSFAGFLAIVAWAFSRRNQHSFDEAANLPFQDESPELPMNGTRAPQASLGGTHE
jgi:cytochrome c oxidase cbb3-type subunit IV